MAELPKDINKSQQFNRELSLMEEVLLLCIRNTGDVSNAIFGFSRVSIENGLAGAVIMELSLREYLKMEKKSNGDEIFIVNQNLSPTGDDILDEAIEIMKDKKDPTINDWLKYLCGTLLFTKGISNFRERIYDRLCEKGILREVQKILGKKHTFKNLVEIDKVANKIRNIASITDNTKSNEISDRDFSLLCLFHALDKPFANKISNCLDI